VLSTRSVVVLARVPRLDELLPPGGREKIAPVDEFSVSRRRAGDVIVVAPAGEIDLATIGAVEAAVQAALAEAPALVLDLREVTFIDSAGLRLVLETSRRVDRFSVVRGPGEVQRVFDLVGLDQRLDMLDEPPDGA
jgi:anti-sigma B factor antagonist